MTAAGWAITETIMKSTLKEVAKKILPKGLKARLVERMIRSRLASTKRIREALEEEIPESWKVRSDDVMACPDNAFLAHVPNAGELAGSFITMHNGVKVAANSYYGPGVLRMLIDNKGAHEPQEERAFEEIVKLLPEQCVMLELGAYWAFYSLSLLNSRPGATCYMVEPDPHNIISGKVNFEANSRTGHFFNAFVDESPKNNPPTISVDTFCSQQGIERIHILHSDIQGFELAMLRGGRHMLSAHLVDYVFISTHSQELHVACCSALREYGYEILASADMEETYSFDGLIVAKSPGIKDAVKVEISKRPARKS